MQMTAYKLEMENLRRNAQEEEAERRRQSSQQMGFKDTTFQLSYGNQGGKAPASGSKGKQGSGSGHGASSQSHRDKASPEAKAMEWDQVHVLRVVLRDTLLGTVRSAREKRGSRPNSRKVGPHHNSSSSKLQPECSTSHGFNSLVNRQRSRHI